MGVTELVALSNPQLPSPVTPLPRQPVHKPWPTQIHAAVDVYAQAIGVH